MSDVAVPSRDAEAVPTGNTFDKYGSRNPVVRRLMAGFERNMFDLLDIAQPSSIIDVGCGEGVLTEQWARRTPGRVVGIDLDDPKLRTEWERRSRPNLEFEAGLGSDLSYGEGEFDAASAMEVLEHVPDPEAVLAEMTRVAGRWLLVSVPREPLWRMLNMSRGAYLGQLGNTPGHLNHWSKRGFAQLLRRYGEIRELRSPFPWTMALVHV
jgi:2-polyprenyl-3-methyl-5-hydroxy-6-metoxy-1,4-benzoquinol methylase